MNVGQISHDKAMDFILGAKSFVTFLNPKTSNRFTYKVVKHKTDDVFFVHVLTGPEVYKYIGIIKNYNFHYSRKSDIDRDSRSVVVFDYVMFNLWQDTLNDSIEIYHDGRCGRCGRQLTTPDSVQSGFGPECIKRVK